MTKLSVSGDKTLVAARLLRKRRPLYMRLDVHPFVVLHGLMFLLYCAALATAPGPDGSIDVLANLGLAEAAPAAVTSASGAAVTEGDVLPNVTNATAATAADYRDSSFYLPSLVGGPLFLAVHIVLVLMTHWFVEFEVG